MKILVFNGSPKKESSTMRLTDAFIKGLGDSNNNEVKIVSSYEKKIKYCMGDLSCWFRQDGHCIITDDDMNGLLDDMIASDIIIWSFPVHCHGIPASLKAIMDRTIAFLKINMIETATSVSHEKNFDLTKKKNVFIVSGGYPFYPDNFAPIKMQLRTYFQSSAIMCICESALLESTDPEIITLKEKLFSQLSSAGREYISKGFISNEMIDRIEKPMIPNATYINIINQLANK